ncbi:RDD family protein [Streptomyces sp. A7024]|uniref:RDD family protein n=1 Tax=Streptomyces coryli TaxID=1128680 RepID=A0A6G4TT34_9ACTN|nr:RDD family protein [Streptomyces coryli]NGN62626.1 RDD family protein [Streptomyces coryli]
MTPPAVQGQRAGIASRAAADLIDLALVGAICGAALLAYGLADFLLTGPAFELPRISRPGAVVGGYLVCVGYLTVGGAMAGRTAGKQVAGLRLVGASGRPLSIGRSALRAVLCVLFPLGLAWVLVDRRNASVQDRLVRTVVLYDWGMK